MKARLSLTHNGRTQTVKDWAAELGVPTRRFYSRIRAGWSVEDVFSEHNRRGEWAGYRRCPYKWTRPKQRAKALEKARSKAAVPKLLRDVWDIPLRDDPWAQAVIDVSEEAGGMTLDEIGHIMGGLCRERVRQIEEVAMRKLRRSARGRDIVGSLRELAALRDSRRDDRGGYDG